MIDNDYVNPDVLLAICQVCVHVGYCDYKAKPKQCTTYEHENYGRYYNTCTKYEEDWVLLIRFGIKEWIPRENDNEQR